MAGTSIFLLALAVVFIALVALSTVVGSRRRGQGRRLDSHVRGYRHR
jgi:hypothetical protein